VKPIILTGTIVPQSNHTAILDWRLRRKEYLNSINFYRKFGGDIFFLENSDYDLSSDTSFKFDNVHIIRHSVLNKDAFSLGKGYQEFAMLDSFITSGNSPSHFFKITGRRIVQNIDFFDDKYDSQENARFDIITNRRTVDVSFFFCSSRFYISKIAAKYHLVNDELGEWIERVLFKSLCDDQEVRFHLKQPDYFGLSGSTGSSLVYPYWKTIVRNMQRSIYGFVGARKL
jgi:hypothetical protein